jgi:hypothetical protein
VDRLRGHRPSDVGICTLHARENILTVRLESPTVSQHVPADLALRYAQTRPPPDQRTVAHSVEPSSDRPRSERRQPGDRSRATATGTVWSQDLLAALMRIGNRVASDRRRSPLVMTWS